MCKTKFLRKEFMLKKKKKTTVLTNYKETN